MDVSTGVDRHIIIFVQNGHDVLLHVGALIFGLGGVGIDGMMANDHDPVFAGRLKGAVEPEELCLPVFSAMIDTLTVNRANMRKAANGGFISATDCADYLAKKGMPFREAYGIVGKLVGHCVDTGHSLETLPLEEYKKVSEYFEEDVYDALSLETCVNGRKVYGGPAPEAVKVQIENIKHFIQERA